MKNIWRITIVILLSFRVAASYAQEVRLDSSLLWRISGNGLHHVSYLFGTMHFICGDDYFWTAKMKQALTDCDKVICELDKSDTAGMTKKVMASMFAKDGKKLSDYFTSDDYALVRQYFMDSLHTDIRSFEEMTPLILEVLVLKNATPCQHPLSYEKRITKIAIENNKETGGLETFEEQMYLMDKPEKVVSSVIKMVKKGKSFSIVYHAMMQLYRRQDINTLAFLGHSRLHDSDRSLNVRNKKWVTKMPAEMQRQSVFFAVGAAHLGGSQGVINLLRKAGYTVTPMTDTVNIYAGSIVDDVLHLNTKASPYITSMPSPGYSVADYLKENLHYPASAQKKGVKGRVAIRFVVNEDGSISGCFVSQHLDPACDEEALRVIKNMPPWQHPGSTDGKQVKVYFTQPVTFMPGKAQ